ncbi:MAG: hypothetical protein M3346_00175 [Actinomycetota bacterium]|nr:hypothetical protein [Actinomycetota bacterium]
MKLVVDFNMREESGLVPALLLRDQIESLHAGEKVIAADGEGTECLAVVRAIETNEGYALLSPVGGTWQHDSTFRPSAEDLLARG